MMISFIMKTWQRLEGSKFQWYCKPLYKQRIMPSVLSIPINLNEIQFEKKCLKIIV